MARFLSGDWFEEVDRQVMPGPAPAPGRPAVANLPVAIEVVVTGGPEGEVRYQVVVEGAGARVRWRREDLVEPGVRFTADFATLSGIAQGWMSAVEALANGNARVAGDTALLARIPGFAELLSPALRAGTTF